MTDVGRRFAYREHARTLGEPVRPVEVVKLGPSRSRKVRIRWLDGEYEGLEEWIPEVRLVAPWEEVGAFLKDECRLLAAIEASGDVYGTLPWKAAQLVFWSIPVNGIDLGYRAAELELLVIEDFEATATRLGLPTEDLLGEPPAFIDRFGHYKAPFQVAVRVAKLCCERFTRAVLDYVHVEEDALRHAIVSGHYIAPRTEGIEYEMSRSRAEDELREREPVFALVREWCGQGAVAEFDQLLALREEVSRLRELVESTARWLRDVGHPVKASRLLRELKQPAPTEHRQLPPTPGP